MSHDCAGELSAAARAEYGVVLVAGFAQCCRDGVGNLELERIASRSVAGETLDRELLLEWAAGGARLGARLNAYALAFCQHAGLDDYLGIERRE